MFREDIIEVASRKKNMKYDFNNKTYHAVPSFTPIQWFLTGRARLPREASINFQGVKPLRVTTWTVLTNRFTKKYVCF